MLTIRTFFSHYIVLYIETELHICIETPNYYLNELIIVFPAYLGYTNCLALLMIIFYDLFLPRLMYFFFSLV